MKFFLLDDRVLLKRYALEPGTDLIDHLFGRVRPDRLACLMLSAAEILAVLVRRRTGRLTPVLFQGGLLQMRAELLQATEFVRFPINNDVILASLAFVDRYRLGAVDSAMLRVALNATQTHRTSGHDLVLMTTKPGLRRAARHEGIVTFNPETQDRSALDRLLEP